jgi:hypothetical protein
MSRMRRSKSRLPHQLSSPLQVLVLTLALALKSSPHQLLNPLPFLRLRAKPRTN